VTLAREAKYWFAKANSRGREYSHQIGCRVFECRRAAGRTIVLNAQVPPKIVSRSLNGTLLLPRAKTNLEG